MVGERSAVTDVARSADADRARGEVREREDAVLATEAVRSPADAIANARLQFVYAAGCYYAVLREALTADVLNVPIKYRRRLTSISARALGSRREVG